MGAQPNSKSHVHMMTNLYKLLQLCLEINTVKGAEGLKASFLCHFYQWKQPWRACLPFSWDSHSLGWMYGAQGKSKQPHRAVFIGKSGIGGSIKPLLPSQYQSHKEQLRGFWRLIPLWTCDWESGWPPAAELISHIMCILALTHTEELCMNVPEVIISNKEKF